MKRLRLLLALCLLAISSPLHVLGNKTIYDEFRMEMDTLFQSIDKTQFKTGILKDYESYFEM